MQNTVRASLGAVEVASSLCGLPFVGAVAMVALDIIEACDEVRIQKVQLLLYHHRHFTP
jgi:hypothetical protein